MLSKTGFISLFFVVNCTHYFSNNIFLRQKTKVTRINGIIGVSKAYITRVGAGPFPSEIEGEAGERIRKAGNEFGSVTGRPRRCGWFDVPLLKYTAASNSAGDDP